ncbi:MAG: Smg protein [Gammaproteobacteria bacterium]|jgi:Smg protein
MKEGVIDVLMYIFSSYADQEDELPEDRDGIDADLREAGFNSGEIDKAFEWLDGLASASEDASICQSPKSIRVYAPEEIQRLSNHTQGFLIFLEQSGVLTPELREMVINRVMALEPDSEIDIEELKWVVMMVLFNSTENHDDDTLLHYEDIVFADQQAVFH